MLPYYLLLFVIMFLSVLARERKLNAIHKNIDVNKDSRYKYLQAVIIAVLIFFVGLRYNTGSDYGNYVNMYSFHRYQSFAQIFDNGFGVLTEVFVKIAYYIYDDPATFFVIYATITYSLYIKVIFQNVTDVIFSMVIFMLAGPFLWPFGALRQCLAAAILFAGHKYLYGRKLLKWILIVFLAFLAHPTALIMLPIYFISNTKLNFKGTVLLVVVTFIIRYSYDFLFEIMSFVKGSDQTQYEYMRSEVNALRVLVTLAPVFLFFFFSKRFEYTDKEKFYIFMAFLNAAFMVSTSQSAYLARISIYTELYTVFAYPILLKHFNRKSKLLAKFAITILFLVYFSFQLTSANLGNYSNVLINEFLRSF